MGKCLENTAIPSFLLNNLVLGAKSLRSSNRVIHGAIGCRQIFCIFVFATLFWKSNRIYSASIIHWGLPPQTNNKHSFGNSEVASKYLRKSVSWIVHYAVVVILESQRIDLLRSQSVKVVFLPWAIEKKKENFLDEATKIKLSAIAQLKRTA